MKVTAARTLTGFSLATESGKIDFVFGAGSDDDEKYGAAKSFDAIRRPNGEFAWRAPAKAKLEVLGLYVPYRADGSPSTAALPDLKTFLIEAGIVEAPAAAEASPPVPALGSWEEEEVARIFAATSVIPHGMKIEFEGPGHAHH